MKMKKLMAALLAGALTFGSVMPASAAWVQSGSDWRYQNEDGSWQISKWFQEAGKWYHFDTNGNAQKGWFKDSDGKWYFLAYNGIMQTGLIKVDNNVYFMNADGSLYVGTMKINGGDYSFTEFGTSNGKPSVGASQTWAGNGNQTGVIVGGGGYSSSSSGSSGRNSDSSSNNTAVVKKQIDQVITGISKNISDTVEIEVKGSNIEIEVTNQEATVAQSALVEEAENALTEILENENVSMVTWGGHNYSKADIDHIDLAGLVDTLGFSDKSVADLVAKAEKHNIVVTLTNGSKASYSVVKK